MTKHQLVFILLLCLFYIAGRVGFPFSLTQPSLVTGAAALSGLLLYLLSSYSNRQKMKKQNNRFQCMFEKAGVGISLMNPGGELFYANPKLEEMFGYSREELLSMTFRDLSYPDDVPPNDHLLQQLLAGYIDHYAIEKRYVRKDGTIIWGKVTSSLMTDPNDRTSNWIVEMVIDITEQKRTEKMLKSANKQLEKMSETDGLTGLFNKRKIELLFQKHWHQAKIQSSPLSILLIDIDCFKQYNDHYGHLQGDECLKSVAHHLQEEAEKANGIAGRYGGEEFLVVLPGCHPQQAIKIADHFCRVIEQQQLPHEKSSVHDSITISTGATGGVPVSSSQPQQWIERADQGLYQSKQAGRNCAHFVSPDRTCS